MKPIDESLPGPVVVWLRLWRAVVLEPLRAADPPWTLERMSAELTRRTGGEQQRLEGGARGDVSGTAKAALQRFSAGERVPARDVVQHLLDIATETLDPPPARARVDELWAAYRAALRITFPLLAELYDCLDERDAARGRAEGLQREKDRLTADLALSQRQEQRARTLLSHTEAELEQAQRAVDIRAAEADRARGEAAELTERARRLEEQLHHCRGDQARLEQEIAVLSERDEHTQALAARSVELQTALEAVRADNDELARMLRTITRALYDAQRRADENEALGGQALDKRHELTLPGPRSMPERRRQHVLALQAVQRLEEQLHRVSSDLAEARAELIRRDAALARLVQEHAEEITSLRAGHVLAEADSVLSLALQSLDPAPAVLPPAADVPTPETTRPASSAGAVAASGSAELGDPQAGHADTADGHGSSAGEDAQTGGAAGLPPRTPQHPGPVPAHRRTEPPAQEVKRQARPRRAKRSLLIISLGVIVALGLGIGWAVKWYADHDTDSKDKASTPSTASTFSSGSVSPTASASASEPTLPPKPSKDPMADIGDQPVNTAAVMKLPQCQKNDVSVLLQPAENSFSGLLADITLEITAADGGTVPCRVDTARNRTAITITSASGDKPLWASAACVDGTPQHRWLQVTRSRPAAVDFTWDRIPNDGGCEQNTFAPADAYLVETTVLGRKAQSSFLMTGDSQANGGSDGGNFFGGPSG